jgi:hypothetical protein
MGKKQPSLRVLDVEPAQQCNPFFAGERVNVHVNMQGRL